MIRARVYIIRSKFLQPLSCILLMFSITLAVSSCRDELQIYYPMTDIIDSEDSIHSDTINNIVTEHLGFYVICEGNMGSNQASLDYYDFETGVYSRNIFPERNPNQVMELGDVGNDVKIYGNQLWLVINCSNKVEVCDKFTAVSRGHVNIPNCRYIAFADGYAYVSSYVGPVGGESVLGSVYKVDTASLTIVDRITVGYQPDELAVVDDKLYVANSGGYQAMQGLGYDNTVSVINLKTFREERKIRVAPNLFRIRADKKGRLWVASRGDRMSIPSRLYMLQRDANGEMMLSDSVMTRVADFDFCGDSIYYYGTVGNQARFGIINMNTLQIVNQQPIHLPEGRKFQTVYGISIHPATHDIYVLDATNYTSSGYIYCFNSEGKYRWDTMTGQIPSRIAYLTRKTISK